MNYLYEGQYRELCSQSALSLFLHETRFAKFAVQLQNNISFPASSITAMVAPPALSTEVYSAIKVENLASANKDKVDVVTGAARGGY